MRLTLDFELLIAVDGIFLLVQTRDRHFSEHRDLANSPSEYFYDNKVILRLR